MACALQSYGDRARLPPLRERHSRSRPPESYLPAAGLRQAGGERAGGVSWRVGDKRPPSVSFLSAVEGKPESSPGL